MSKSGPVDFRLGTFRTVKVSENRGDESCRCVNKSLGLRFSIRDFKIAGSKIRFSIRGDLKIDVEIRGRGGKSSLKIAVAGRGRKRG